MVHQLKTTRWITGIFTNWKKIVTVTPGSNELFQKRGRRWDIDWVFLPGQHLYKNGNHFFHPRTAYEETTIKINNKRMKLPLAIAVKINTMMVEGSAMPASSLKSPLVQKMADDGVMLK